MVNVAVEGVSDVGAATRVVEVAGHTVLGVPRPAGGRTRLDPKIPKYHQAARWDPWIVFRDSDDRCPVALRTELMASIQDPHPNFVLRIAHTMTETWFLADVEGFAEYFAVSKGKIPADPESLGHGKQLLLRLCSESSSRAIREEVVAANLHAGPLFVDHLNEFAMIGWDVNAAATVSPSLRRAIERIASLGRDVS